MLCISSGHCPIQRFFVTLWLSGIGHTTAEATNSFHNAWYECLLLSLVYDEGNFSNDLKAEAFRGRHFFKIYVNHVIFVI